MAKGRRLRPVDNSDRAGNEIVRSGISKYMVQKLNVLLAVIVLIFVLLFVKIFYIGRDNGEKYKRQVLSQQEYDSIVLPAKRGEIIDRNGTKIAVSQKVYNVCIDSKKLNQEDGKFLQDTLSLLFSSNIKFRYSEQEIRNYISQNPGSQYRVIAKKQSYDVVSGIMEAINDKENYPNVAGVWLEEDYMRTYPYNSLACDVIGFVQGDNEGAYGLEEFYNSTLNGTSGREYGYLNDDENLERTVKPAVDGHTLKTSIDVNIQSIVEKHILAFNKEHENEYREGNGSNNTGVIIMNPKTGEVVAMASYPVYDLNNPRDEANIKVDFTREMFYGELFSDEENGEGNNEDGTANESTNEGTSSNSLRIETVTEGQDNAEQGDNSDNANVEEQGGESTEPTSLGITSAADSMVNTNGETFEEAYEKAKMEAFNSLWKNFCINSTYEPGSTMKPFTMAIGLEEGIFNGNESYVCNGVLEVGDHKIHCNNRLGHGPLSFSGALEQSCNVAFMKMGANLGRELYMKYNKLFNFGLKTNVDLTGEARTETLVFDEKRMTPTDLAIGSFGQGFNVTMIQMATGYCSLINGGKYYQPHLVTEVLDSNGATIEKIEPRILKQTVSEETSEKIKEMCVNVVSLGTGKSARPAGYMIGGKTGTAETLPRGNGEYIVSFMGFAPAENPELVIYTVIDRPNVPAQASAKYATVLTKDILTEVLPYLNVPKTEEITEKEAEELREKQIEFADSSKEEVEEETTEEGEPSENPDSDESKESVIQIVDEKGNPVNSETLDEEYKPVEVKIDKETGYAIDPNSGELVDPNTGELINNNVSDLPE
ncbi:MAG: penicillin-binding transpeptidase domain-containing protein [Lachnospiraceae bacterium]|nr:penicillin-binding transpeptidase domain-containing protein [Lachnospiraceae bacterium]